MTEEQAITMFMTSVGKHLDENSGNVSAREMAKHMVSDFCFEHLLDFVTVFKGTCGCPPDGQACVNKLVSAVANCMERCDQLYSPKTRPQSTDTPQ